MSFAYVFIRSIDMKQRTLVRQIERRMSGFSPGNAKGKRPACQALEASVS
jgi:hypothetical protein